MTVQNRTLGSDSSFALARRVLIVEDEVVQRRLLQSMVDRAGFVSEVLSSGQEALDRLAAQDLPPVDVILLDQIMPGMNGLEVLDRLKRANRSVPVIMLTGQASVNVVVDAMRAGATDFIVKPASADRLRTALQAAIDGSAMAGDAVSDLSTERAKNTAAGLNAFDQPCSRLKGFDCLIGDSDALEKLIRFGKKAAQTSIPVLIEGESGVGKEVFARAIHTESDRRSGRFVAVNCGAIPDNLVESILFGHEKGAFTGATEQRTGMFQQAHGGTLFLDEVGELPPDVQVKLLRALQEREIHPVGGKAAVKVDIRVISATNRTLVSEVEKGHFREDLFYRLNVFPVVIPPLRDRAADIPLLADNLLDRVTLAEGIQPKRLSQSAHKALEAHYWPGNIRQLQNALFRAAVLSDSSTLQPEDFPILSAQIRDQSTTIALPLCRRADTSLEDNSGYVHAMGNNGHIRPMAAVERDMIRAALVRYNGRMAEVARRLDIGRSTLYRKVALYGLEEDIGA